MVRRAEDRGNPSATRPSEVRRILQLSRATRNDVFYDLGCGHGRVCIIAACKVKKAVGIEDHIATYKRACKQVRKAGLQEKVKIRNSDAMTARIREATIVYSTLSEASNDVEHFERVLKRGCRFISAGVPLIGVKPDRRDGIFYLLRVPFKHATSEDDWARAVLNRKNAGAVALYKRYRKWYGRKFVRCLRTILLVRIRRWSKECA